MKRAVAASALLSALGGCTPDPPAPVGDAGAPTAQASATDSAAAAAAKELPVPADFEAEADRAIDGDNYRRELDTIVAELGGEPAEPADAGSDAAGSP